MSTGAMLVSCVITLIMIFRRTAIVYIFDAVKTAVGLLRVRAWVGRASVRTIDVRQCVFMGS